MLHLIVLCVCVCVMMLCLLFAHISQLHFSTPLSPPPSLSIFSLCVALSGSLQGTMGKLIKQLSKHDCPGKMGSA